MRLEIPIEFLIILAILFVLVTFGAWFMLTKALMKRKYNPDHDVTKKGEDHRKELIARGEPDPIRSIEIGSISPTGSTEPEASGVLPSTTFEFADETNSSDGKSSGNLKKLTRFLRGKK